MAGNRERARPDRSGRALYGATSSDDSLLLHGGDVGRNLDRVAIVGVDLRRRLGAGRLFFGNVDDAQHDAPVNRIDFQDPRVEVHPLVDHVGGAVDHRALPKLRDRHETLDVVADVHDDALVHQANDVRPHLRAHRIRLADAEPRILLRLLETEADALVLGIDVQNHHIDRITLLHDLGRVLDALRPAHVGDVNEAVDTGLDFDERAEAGQVSHLAVDPRPDRVLERQHDPRILLRLLHAERDLLLVRIDLEHHRLDRLADADELRWVSDVARPAHLADVHEAFDARLQLDECAVVRDADNLALYARPHRILLGDVLPRIALELFESERDALTLPVDVEHLDLELRSDLHELGRMRDTPPRHVGDVQQTVDAAEIDERPEVGDVLHDALPDLILLELLHELLTLPSAFVLQDHTTRNHNVSTSLIELDDLELELLAEQLVDVRNATERDLRPGQERVDAHEVDDHTALDLLDQRALDWLIVLVGETDALPHAHEVRLLLRQDDRAFLILEVLQQDLDLIADLEVREVLELLEWNTALRFEADVEHDHVVADLEDVGFDDLALVDRRHGAVVHLHHRFELVGRISLVVDEFGAQVGKGGKLRTLRVALLASAQRRLVGSWNLELSHTGKRSPETRVIFARRAESEGTCVPIMATHGWPPGHSPVGQIGANLKIYWGRLRPSTAAAT